MLRALRNRAIATAFEAWVLARRAKRRLRHAVGLRVDGLDHITLPVYNLATARQFYCEVLGAEHLMTIDAESLKRFGRPPAPNNGQSAYHLSLLLGGAVRIDLFLQDFGQPPLSQPHPHYAFRVSPGQLDAWKERLTAHGVPSEGPLQLGFPGQASLYFMDQSGNHLELTCTGYGKPIPQRPPTLEGLRWSSEHTGLRD